MFPPGYDLRVVDMNVTSLDDSDLEWADIVFTSTMIVQRISLEKVIERCNRAGVPVVAGGPHPTTFHDEIDGVSHFVLDEAEENFPEFLRDLASGNAKDNLQGARKAGRDTNAGAALRPHRHERLLLHGGAILPWLSRSTASFATS